MAGPTIAADLAAGSVAMVAKARYTLEHVAVFINTVTPMTLEAGEKSKYIPKFEAVTAHDLQDGVEMTDAESLVITGTTHTTDEAGLKVVITKKLRHQLKEDAYRAAGIVIGNAMGKKMDKDGLGLYSGLSSGLGSGSTTFSLGYLAASVAQLIGQAEPAPYPISCVIHPYTFNTIVDSISQPGTSHLPEGLQLEVLRDYWGGNDKLYSVPIFRSGNIVPNASNYAYGGIYSKMAFIHLSAWAPESWVEYKNSLRGWELGIVSDYSMVEEDDGYGRYLYFDATAPTS